VIYFIEAVGTAMIKIGHTNQTPAARLQTLQVGCPVRLLGLGLMVGDREDEVVIHRRFASLKMHGEWFRDSSKIRNFIVRECQPWESGRCDRLLTVKRREELARKKEAENAESHRLMQEWGGPCPSLNEALKSAPPLTKLQELRIRRKIESERKKRRDPKPDPTP
jgi:hypothetical protein